MRFLTRSFIVAALGFLLAGCGPGTPKTYPVSGKLSLSSGDVSQLAGHFIEASLEGDPNVRASGVIGPDGSFSLETLHSGIILKGVLEGKYQVRIVRGEEDDDGKKLKKPPVAPRYLKFDSAGLSLDVPPPGDVVLKVQPH